jgi:hypothetical protein
MTTLIESILTLLHRGIKEFSEKLREEFSVIQLINVQLMWCEMQRICDTKEVLAGRGSLLQNISSLISNEIWKFSEKLHEGFPGISAEDLLSVWCELQQMCDFEFPERGKQHPLAEKLLPTNWEIGQEEHNTKRVSNIFCTR